MALSIHCIEVICRAYVTGNTSHTLAPSTHRTASQERHIRKSAGALNDWENNKSVDTAWIDCYAGLFLADFRSPPGISPPRCDDCVQRIAAASACRICSNKYFELIIAEYKRLCAFTVCSYQFYFYPPNLPRCRSPPPI